MCLEVLVRFAEECYQLGMKYQYPVDDKLFIFFRHAADNTSIGPFTTGVREGRILEANASSEVFKWLRPSTTPLPTDHSRIRQISGFFGR